MASQKGLFAFLFAAIKYKSTPKNAEINIKYTNILTFPTDLFDTNHLNCKASAFPVACWSVAKILLCGAAGLASEY
jgi:hypothetical protein